MAQASIELLKRENIIVTTVSPNLITCRLDIDKEIIVKKVKGELKACLTEKAKTVCLKGDFLKIKIPHKYRRASPSRRSCLGVH